jgi:hypothetical protein
MSDKQFTPFAVIPKTTRLGPSMEKMYKAWVLQNNVPTSNDYDMRGYFLDTVMGKAAPTEINVADNQTHYPDTYKLPNHPSFSNESIYAKPNESRHWVENPAPYKEGTWALQDKGGNIKVEIPQPQAELYQGQPDLPVEPFTLLEEQILSAKPVADLFKYFKK